MYRRFYAKQERRRVSFILNKVKVCPLIDGIHYRDFMSRILATNVALILTKWVRIHMFA